MQKKHWQNVMHICEGKKKSYSKVATTMLGERGGKTFSAR